MMELAFNAEIIAGMKKMLSAMEALCGQSSGTPYDKVYAFYKKYYLGIKNYFPATLVNADAKRYEIAKIAYDKGQYTNDTDPITQSHGDFFSAETAWVKKRIMYIMSKYSYGLFSADGTDTIIVRAAGDLIEYEITPAFDMYPAIANGTSIVQGKRTKAGDVCRMVIDLGGSADQQNAIQAASWLLSIGDWHKKSVSGTMVVRGRRLTELILGSKTDPVVITITGLTIADCGSMQKVLLSNIPTLQGTLDLSACQNIREIYADGTNLSQIKVPEGGSLEVIEYPANNKYISFKNFPLLSTEGLIIGQCAGNITDFWVENCPLLNPMKLLSDIIEAQQSQGDAHALKHIRAIGFNEEYYTADALDMLARMSDGSYSGLSAEGLSGEDPIPVLEGTITVHSKYYQDSVDSLRNVFTKLNLIIDGEPYIRFKDNAFFLLCLRYWDADHDGGITYTEGETAMPTLPDSAFGDNTSIIDATDFKYLDWQPSGSVGLFKNCTNLKYASMKDGTRLPGEMFYNCTSLEKVDLPATVLDYENRGGVAFKYCKSLRHIKLPLNKQFYGGNYFEESGLEELEFPDAVVEIASYACFKCQSLSKVTIGTGITAIRNAAFNTCPAMESCYIKAVTPPVIDAYTFDNNHCLLYVPRARVDAYKSATNWSKYASRIYGYDFN